MTCDQLRDEYELYALGLAEEPERSELRQHLDRGCDVCVPGVRAARQTVTLVGAAVSPAQPPARLRRRVLASVGQVRSGWGWIPLWAGVAACALVAAFYFSGREKDTVRELARAREELRLRSLDLARLNDALALLNDPEARQVSFGERARGKVFVNPRRGVLLVASSLPPAPAGKIYEMWVIPKTGKPVAAGLFQSSPDGTALHLLNRPVALGTTAAIAVTLEPAGGVEQPTSQPLIVAAL